MKDCRGCHSLRNFCRWPANQVSSIRDAVFNGKLFTQWLFYFLGYKHTERQASSGSFEVLTLVMTLGNGSGTHFEASQCIPMGPCRCC